MQFFRGSRISTDPGYCHNVRIDKKPSSMTKADKLWLRDRILLCMTAFTLASSILLEAMGSRHSSWIWIHIIMGCMFPGNVVWHLYLHFGWKAWFQKLRKQVSPVTRSLAIFTLLTIISAVAAFIHWVGSFMHSALGGIHGKIGLAFLIPTIGHTIKRIGFYRSKRYPV